MRNIQLIILLFCTVLCNSVHASATENPAKPATLSKHLETLTPAKRIKLVKPKYPIEQGRDGAEGWVQLSYIIDKNGDIQNLIVLDHDGPRAFIVEAKRAVKKWKFEPAENAKGEKILSCKNSVQLDFSMHGNGVDNFFLDLLKTSFLAIQTKDSGKLEKLVSEIDDFRGKSSNEWAWTHYIKMKYFSLIGDIKQSNTALKKAFSYVKEKNPSYTEPAALDILQNILALQIEQQLYSDARATFNKLKLFESEHAKILQTHFQPYMTQVNQLIAGNKNIRVKGNISSDYWSHSLVRNKFSISNVEGEIDRVEVRCDYKHSKFSVKEDNVWKIPKHWGQCNIVIEGEKGSKFDIYELPELAE